uniref:Uncharacterized protein n=1 Tax=Aegilops tauschii subsp. strangulata TaxID=200361 RepID=A0A453H6A3_AEGTS
RPETRKTPGFTPGEPPPPPNPAARVRSTENNASPSFFRPIPRPLIATFTPPRVPHPPHLPGEAENPPSRRLPRTLTDSEVELLPARLQ